MSFLFGHIRFLESVPFFGFIIWFFFQFYPTFFSTVFDFFSNVYGSLKFTPNFISCIRLLKEVSYFLALYGFIFNRKRFFFNRMWLCLNRLRLFINRLRPFFNRIRLIKINSNFLVAYGIFVQPYTVSRNGPSFFWPYTAFSMVYGFLQ